MWYILKLIYLFGNFLQCDCFRIIYIIFQCQTVCSQFLIWIWSGNFYLKGLFELLLLFDVELSRLDFRCFSILLTSSQLDELGDS